MDTTRALSPCLVVEHIYHEHYSVILLIFVKHLERHCGKLWTFTRVPEYELSGPGDLEIRNVYTRRQCQDECLRGPRGPCRSAACFSYIFLP